MEYVNGDTVVGVHGDIIWGLLHSPLDLRHC